MGSRERLASRISHSVLQMVTRLSYPLYSSRKDDGSLTARPAPWHRAPPLILSHLPNHSPVSLHFPRLPHPLNSSLRSNRITSSLDLECPYCLLCLLRSSHFPQSSTSTASSITPSFTAKQLPFLFPSHMLSCAFTQYR